MSLLMLSLINYNKSSFCQFILVSWELLNVHFHCTQIPMDRTEAVLYLGKGESVYWRCPNVTLTLKTLGTSLTVLTMVSYLLTQSDTLIPQALEGDG